MKLLINLITITTIFTSLVLAADPLPSWNKSAVKSGIIEFVADVTDKNSKHYVVPAERIAVFDNDGTLWIEKPVYTQLLFAIDRVHDMAPQHPEWKTQQPFKAVLENDMKTVLKSGEKGLLEIVMATHAGTNTEEYTAIVKDWMKITKHPKFKQPFSKMIYQPMLELLDYLRDNEFKTYIVSGGGIEFVRPISQQFYGIPPEQVVGSSIKTEYVIKNGKPTLVRLPEINFIDDKAGKPVGIHEHIGRRPIAAFGNSDGDYQMLQWTTTGPGKRLGVILHHTDADREYAYDRESHVGRLDKGLDDSPKYNWLIIDMKKDWNQVFPK